MISLSKKWVLITGAARGVGRQMALAFAERGANLVLHSRNLEHTKNLEEELKEKGVQAISIAAELSDCTAREKFLAGVDSKNLEISVVCNNAGIMAKYRENFWETHEDDYISMYQVNTIAPIHISNHFLPKMLKAGFGRVICTGSGIAEQPELMAYATAKYALYKFVIDMSPKLKCTDVSLNLLDPGWLRTDLGGPNAPNSVETAIPGTIAAAFAKSTVNGKWISAQDYTGLSLEKAVEKLNASISS